MDNTSKPNTQNQTSSIADDFPSLNLATNYTWDLLTAQTTRANALDSKANFILGAATTLVGAALVLLPSILTSHTNCSIVIPSFLQTLPHFLKGLLLVLPLIIIYVIVMGLAYQAYKIRTYTEVPDPRRLLDEYLDKPEDYTKAVVIQSLVDAYEENETVITNKANYNFLAFTFLMIEALILVILLLLRVTC